MNTPFRRLIPLVALSLLAGAATLHSQTVDSFNPGVGALGFNPTVYCVTP